MRLARPWMSPELPDQEARPRPDLGGIIAFGVVQTTRGSPLNGGFCSVTTFQGARYRQRPIANVVREFRSIREKDFPIVDDNWNRQ